MSELLDLIPKTGLGKHNALEACNMATYELGSVVRCLVYAFAHHNLEQRKDERVYLNLAVGELSDLVTQCRLLAEHFNIAFDELIAMGEERFRERMEQMRAKTGRFG